MLIQEKVNQAKAILKEFDIDCWITFTRESQINGDPTLAFLISAAVTWHSVFAVTKTGRTHAIVGRYDKKTVVESNAYNEVIAYVEGFKEPFLNFMREENPAKIAINYSEDSEICDGLTHGMYLTLYNTLSEIGFQNRLIPAEKIVSALRERKSITEIQNIKAAIKHTLEIFEKVKNFIQVGKTEKEIATFMSDEVKRRGLETAWEASVCPSVFTGPETAEAHYAPSQKKVAPGHVLNMDFGVKVNKYCSDLQRTFYILEKGEKYAPPEVQRGFDTIVDAIESARVAMKPGMLGKDIDQISRDIIVKAGYEEFPHALGHQVGMFSHDGTALLGPDWEKYAHKPFQKLEKGMVFTIEPRLPVANRGIVTIEEMVVITKDGAEYLSNPQKDLILI